MPGKLQLPDSVSSLQDLRSLSVEIRSYAKWASHITIQQKLRTSNAPAAQPVLSAGCVELLNSWASKQPLTTSRVDELLEALADLESTAPSMTITLAAPAAGELRRELVAWCRHNLGDTVLVNFQFNSTILGGMVVRYGSHVYDWSFRRQILANRQAFPQVLRHV